jgi:hypothetical protein
MNDCDKRCWRQGLKETNWQVGERLRSDIHCINCTFTESVNKAPFLIERHKKRTGITITIDDVILMKVNEDNTITHMLPMREAIRINKLSQL